MSSTYSWLVVHIDTEVGGRYIKYGESTYNSFTSTKLILPVPDINLTKKNRLKVGLKNWLLKNLPKDNLNINAYTFIDNYVKLLQKYGDHLHTPIEAIVRPWNTNPHPLYSELPTDSHCELIGPTHRLKDENTLKSANVTAVDVEHFDSVEGCLSLELYYKHH